MMGVGVGDGCMQTIDITTQYPLDMTLHHYSGQTNAPPSIYHHLTYNLKRMFKIYRS